MSDAQVADVVNYARERFGGAKDDPATAARVATATHADGTIVKNIDQQARQTVSSITTVDLRGISDIEEAFTIALAGLTAWKLESMRASRGRTSGRSTPQSLGEAYS